VHALSEFGALTLTEEHRETISHLHPGEMNAEARVRTGAESAVGRFGCLGVQSAAIWVLEESTRVELKRVAVKRGVAVVRPCLRGNYGARSEIVATNVGALSRHNSRKGTRYSGVETERLVDGGIKQGKRFKISILEVLWQTGNFHLEIFAQLRPCHHIPEGECKGVGGGTRACEDQTGSLDLDIDVSQRSLAAAFLFGFVKDRRHQTGVVTGLL